MGTSHALSLGSNNHALTANPNTTGAGYADIAARDADTDFNTDTLNIDKVVRVEDADGSGTIGYFILVSVDPTWESLGASLTDSFLELIDTPANYTGDTLKGIRVNAGETALEFHNLVDTYLKLPDTPSSFLTAALQGLRVNAGETALEFVALVETFLALSDVPSSYSSQAGNTVIVNVGETALEFTGPPVIGPASATDNALVRFDSTTGKLVENSLGILNDAGILSGITWEGVAITEVFGGTAQTSYASGDILFASGLDTLAKLAAGSTDQVLSITGGLPVYRSAPATFGDVVGPGSATDNALARFDLGTGKLIQDSLAILTDAGALSGLTQLDVDNLRLDGNTLSTTDTDGDLVLSPDGMGTVDVSTSLTIQNAGAGADPVLSSNSATKDLLLDGNFEIEIAEPVVVGTLFDSVNLDNVFSIYVVGDYAYMAAFDSDSLAIINISDPTTPVLTGVLIDAVELNGAREVWVAGDFAYVCCAERDSFAIVDISDPTAPTLLGSLRDTVDMNFPTGVYVVGHYAYVCASISHSLSIIDIRDPANPTLAGRLIDATNMNRAAGLYVVGNFAYVIAEVGDSLAVVDISDPTNPVLRDTLVDAVNMNSPRGIFVVGNHAYVAGFASDSLAVIDVSDPDNIVLTGSVLSGAFLDGCTGLYVSGNFAYCGAGDRLTIVDVSDPTTPVIVESLQDGTNLGSTSEIHVAGKYIYAASRGTDCLTILETSRIVDVPTAFIGSLGVSNLDVLGNAVVTNDFYANGVNAGPGGIAWNGVPVSRELAISNVLTVRELSDLPTASGGAHDVSAFNQIIFRVGSLDLGTNKILTTSSALSMSGLSALTTVLTSSNADGTIDSNGFFLSVQEMDIANTGSNTRSIRHTGAASVFFLGACVIQDDIELATFGSVTIEDSQLEGLTNFTSANATSSITFRTINFVLGTAISAILFDINATIGRLEIDNALYAGIAGGHLLEIENPDEIAQATIRNSPLGNIGEVLQCTPVSSSNFTPVSNNTRGACVDADGNLITTDITTGNIVRYVGLTSTVDVTISAPGTNVQGVTWYKGDLYSANIGGPVRRHDGFSTTILETVSITESPIDLTFAGANLVIVDNAASLVIIKEGFSDTTLSSFAVGTFQAGLSFDGINLLVVHDNVCSVMKGVTGLVQYDFLTPLGFSTAVDKHDTGVMFADNNRIDLINHPVTLDQSSATWELMDNSGAASPAISSDRGGASFDNGTVFLDVAVTQDVWTDIGDAGTDIFYGVFGENEKCFLSDEEIGELTWTGVRERGRTISAFVSVIRDGATNRVVELAIVINDDVQEDSKTSVFLNSTADGLGISTLPISRDLDLNDRIQMQVKDRSSSNGLTFSLAKIGIT